MKITYKLEIKCMIGEFTCVIRKVYFRNKMYAEIYKNKILRIYYYNGEKYKSFSHYMTNEDTDKIDNVKKIILYLYDCDPWR